MYSSRKRAHEAVPTALKELGLPRFPLTPDLGLGPRWKDQHRAQARLVLPARETA
jgi:hypothetical protein